MRSSLVCIVAVLVAAGASASEREGPWRLLKRHAAGKGAAGEQLTVVEFEATPKGSMDDGEGCDGLLHRFVLEAKRSDGTVKKTVLVGEACNACWDHGIPVDLGSYGVGKNRFTLDRTGCDSSAHHVLSLSPLRLLDDYVVDPVESGTGERCPPPDASGDGMLAPVPYEYVVIPSVANPELLGDFVNEAWRSVARRRGQTLPHYTFARDGSLGVPRPRAAPVFNAWPDPGPPPSHFVRSSITSTSARTDPVDAPERGGRLADPGVRANPAGGA